MLKGELDKKLLKYDNDLPKEFTIPNDRIPPVHNQHIGTTSYQCMAYATAGIMRILHRLWFGEDIRFSVAYIYGKYRKEANRTGKPMFVSDLIPGIVNGGAIPFDMMPDFKEPSECYDYVYSHSELDKLAKTYSVMFEGYINLKDKTKQKTYENIKKAILQYKMPLYGEMVGHGIIFCGFKGDYVLYRDSDGSNWLKKLHYKDIKESFLFIMADKEAKKFIDVPNSHWAKKAINYCTEKEYMQGVNEDYFDPNKPLTRAEIAQILYNYDKANGK